MDDFETGIWYNLGYLRGDLTGTSYSHQVVKSLSSIRSQLWLDLALLLGLVLAGCLGQPRYEKVNLAVSGQEVAAVAVGQSRKLPLRVAVAAVISPKATLSTYAQLLDYLSVQLDRPVELIQRPTYAEINTLLRDGQADLAFVCGGAYVEGHRDFGMEVLVAPRVRGVTLYNSYIIVPRDSEAQSLADLRGKTFAFSDPLSNSGRLWPEYRLLQMNETPERFFHHTIFTYSHDNSIKAVAEKLVDGAAVDSLVYDFTIARSPEYSRLTRVIEKSPDFGVPPVVVHPALNLQLKEQLRTVLLNMDQDERGYQILRNLMIDRFVVVEESLYDSIREMAAQVRKRNAGP